MNMDASHTGFAPSNYISQHNHTMPGLSPQMFIMPMQMYPNSFYYCQKTPEQNGTANIQNQNQLFSQYFRYCQEQQQYQHQLNNPQFLQQIDYYSPSLHQIQHRPMNSSLQHQPLKSQSALDSLSSSIKVKIEDSDLNQAHGIQQAARQRESSQFYQQQQQQHQVETDSTTGERSPAVQDDMHVRPTSNTVYQQKQQYEQENLLKIKILPTLKRSYQTNETFDAEKPTPSKKVCCVSMIKNTLAMINHNETVKKPVEIISQFRPKDRQRKSKQDYYNDSNYTKNLLKGFKRYINRFGEQQEGIVLSEFEAFFDKEPLNNELILKCFAHDVYNEAFSNFLSQDPTWWVNEARIKDTDKQIAFFQLCQERNFSSIKTKRKSFQRPLI